MMMLQKLKILNVQMLFPAFIISSLIVFTIISCKSVPPADCISQLNDDLIITWGDYYHETGRIEAKKLTVNGEWFTVHRESSKSKKVEKRKGKIPQEKYCTLLSRLRLVMLEAQALNAPGEDVSRYIEYNSMKSNIEMRGLWNPKFQTVGSKGFREVWDSLEAAVNIK